MDEQKYTVCYSGVRGTEYLCCVETHCYGERILGYFDLARATAMPLTYEQAKMICNLLKSDLPCRTLRVVRVPWEYPESEVTGNA